jgi:predicted ATPase/DNA-binding winged helix-turn-helix (wHTH) protein
LKQSVQVVKMISPEPFMETERSAVVSRLSGPVSFGEFRLLSEARLLERNGQPMALGSRALDILTLLVERAGTVVPKRDLLAHAWPGLTVEENSLRVQIAAIRKALGDGVGGARYISNIPGRGYCFVSPIILETEEQASDPPHPYKTDPERTPLAKSGIIGREEISQRILFLLYTNRFVTIHGPGGIGKTSVAKCIAETAQSAFDGNVVFLDLAAIQDQSLVTTALASALGLIVHASDPAPSVMARLKEIRALIVLDCCEHIIESAATIAELINTAAPQASILATSREPLRAAGEHVVPLAPLELPPADNELSISEVLQFPAAKLFADRAYAAGLASELSDADAATLTSICHDLDGIPLALEIAASRAGRHGLAETAQLLDGRFRLAWRGKRSAAPRQQTLYATLDWSYNLISQREQFALQQLAVFPRRFTLMAAEALAGESLGGGELLGETIDDLVAKSLISVDLSQDTARYRLLDTTRAYARAKLEERGAIELVAAQHARYVASALADLAAQPGNSSADRGAASDLLADVRLALTWCFGERGDPALGARLSADAAPLFLSFSLFDECRRWLERALQSLSIEDRGSRVEMCIEDVYGNVLMLIQSNNDRARGALERAASLAAQLGDAAAQFRIFNRLQILHRRTGEFDRLLPLTERIEDLASKLGDVEARTSAQLMRGATYSMIGQQRLALPLLESAFQKQLTAPLEIGHYAYLGDVRVPLSMTLWLCGYPDKAAEAAAAISTGVGNDLFACLGLAWGAAVFQTLGDCASTDQRAALLLEKSKRNLLAPYQAVSTGFAGDAAYRQGELNEAIVLLKDAAASLRAANFGLYVSIFERSLAIALAEAGQVADALRIAHLQISRCEEMGGAYDLAEWIRIKGEASLHGRQHDAAEDCFRMSMAVAKEQGAVSWQLRTATSLADLMSGQGRKDEASALLCGALEPFEEGFTSRDLVVASNLLEAIDAA